MAAALYTFSYIPVIIIAYDVPSCTALLFGSRELYLDSIDPIDAVNEEDQYEYEGYL